MATIEILDGPDQGKRYELWERESVIGRHPSCELPVLGNSISRQHCRITFRDDGYYLEDLNSLNGTFVNGNRLESRVKLEDGDVIHVHSVPAVFRLQSHEVAGGEEGGVSEGDPDGARARVAALRKQGLDSETEWSASSAKAEKESGPRPPQVLQSLDLSANIDVETSSPRKLSAMMSIMQRTMGIVDLSLLLDRVVEGMLEVFPQADRGHLLLSVDDGDAKVCWASKHRGDEGDAAGVTSLGPLSKSVTKWVLSHGQAILGSDAYNVEDVELTQSVHEIQIRSTMYSPILGPSGDPMGIVYLDTSDSLRAFAQEDLEVFFCAGLAAAQGIALAYSLERSVEKIKKAHNGE